MPYAVDTPPAIVQIVQDAIQAAMPKAATVTPPPTDVGGAQGSSEAYARADHTHATSVQRRRWSISVAGQPNEWIFSKPYDAGVVPVVTCTAENVSGATRPFVVNTVGTPTNLSVKVAVFQAAQPTVSIIGINLTLFGNAAVGTTVNCQAAKPTQ